jgi:hypothetical protein
MIDVREYVDAANRSPFGRWFASLNAPAAARVTMAVTRLGLVTSRTPKAWAAACLNTRSNSAPATEFTSERTATELSSCWAERKSANTATSQTRYKIGAITNTGNRTPMPLTKSFRATIRNRVQSDPAFRKALLREAIESMLSGDIDTGKTVLRDYINATDGFAALEKRIRIPAKSLMRMFGPKGNPTAENLFGVIAHLQRQEGVRFKLRSHRADESPARE